MKSVNLFSLRKVIVFAGITFTGFQSSSFACGGMVFPSSLLCTPVSGGMSSPVSLGVLWVPTRPLGGGTPIKYPPQLSGATTQRPNPITTYPGGMGYFPGYPSYGMQSYGSMPSYGVMPGYGATPSYGVMPGYGATPSYGAMPSYGFPSVGGSGGGCSPLSSFGLAPACTMNGLASFGLPDFGMSGLGSLGGCGGMSNPFVSLGSFGSFGMTGGCSPNVMTGWGGMGSSPAMGYGVGYPGYGSSGYGTMPVTTLPAGPSVNICATSVSTHSGCATPYSNPYATTPVYSPPTRVVCFQCGLARNLMRPITRGRTETSQRFY